MAEKDKDLIPVRLRCAQVVYIEAMIPREEAKKIKGAWDPVVDEIIDGEFAMASDWNYQDLECTSVDVLWPEEEKKESKDTFVEWIDGKLTVVSRGDGK